MSILRVKDAKVLLAIDFDHTLIDVNSDSQILSLSRNGKLPKKIEALAKGENGWTDYMRHVFKFLHLNGVTKSDYETCLANMPLTPGMKELLTSVHGTGNYDIIVISDANTVFIEHILQTHGLTNKVSDVFSNISEYDEEGCLTIQEFQSQNFCDLCTRNICKGSVLMEYIRLQFCNDQKYSRVVYIGDGSNDVCPALKLEPIDCVFARSEYRMAQKLKKIIEKGDEPKMEAPVHEWSSGDDILKILFPE